jgi:hypothetical protein
LHLVKPTRLLVRPDEVQGLQPDIVHLGAPECFATV